MDGKKAVVYVKVPERKHTNFLYREVVLGEDVGNFYVIKSGLEEGEEIATNGVFKIDAAAQLSGKKSMMNPTGNKTAPNSGLPVLVITVMAKKAARASIAPAMKARINVSLVDMKIFCSPASTILVTNSLGSK